MGIVHHAAYFPYLEEARVAWLRHIGHPYDAVRNSGVDFAVLEAFMQYRMAVRFDELVDVHVAIGAATRTTFQMGYLLSVGSEVRATGGTVHGALNRSGRPIRLPSWLATTADPAGTSEERSEP